MRGEMKEGREERRRGVIEGGIRRRESEGRDGEREVCEGWLGRSTEASFYLVLSFLPRHSYFLHVFFQIVPASTWSDHVNANTIFGGGARFVIIERTETVQVS